MFQKKINFLIVGLGAAGTHLSYQLLKSGKTFLVIDNAQSNSSSRVAAGIINYITGKRMVKTWMADEIIPFAVETYRELETLLDTTFYYSTEILKLIQQEDELNEIVAQQDKRGLTNYISIEKPVNIELQEILAPTLAALTIHNTGYVDVKSLINKYAEYLSKQNVLLTEDFDTRSLTITSEGISYNNIIAEKVIFCEGYKSIYNPYFNWLPLDSTYGDVITVKLSKAIVLKNILYKGIYMVPIAENTYKVGATYFWHTADDTLKPAGKEELIKKLKNIIKVPFEVLEHQAAIRPTVKDRRPLIGFHPTHPQIGIFNGMGTKGISLAPYWAKHFVEHITQNSPLSIEVDIKRFI